MNKDLEERLAAIHKENFNRLLPIAEEALLEAILANNKDWYHLPIDETFKLRISCTSEYNDEDYDPVCSIYYEGKYMEDLGGEANLVYILGELAYSIIGAELNLANKTCKLCLRS